MRIISFITVFMLALMLVFVSVAIPAQEANTGFWQGFGKIASFGKPFWADMHSTIIRVEAAYASNSLDYDWGEFGTKNRFYIFANLGVDIPVWYGNFNSGKYGFSVTLPFFIDTWYDRFEFKTSPIINMAYRFSAFDIGFIYRLDETVLFFNNWAVKLSLLKHESTHLGDELVIFRKEKGFDITRIDVLTNYAEMIFILNDPDGKHSSNHGFKFGLIVNYKNGWYTFLESEADPAVIQPSKFPFEFFLQYQYQSNLFSRGFQFIASAEYRIRQQFNYQYYTYSGNKVDRPNNETNLANCINLFAGIRYDTQKSGYFSKTGIGVRCYYGINPYGQFRSMPNFTQWGIAVLFE